MTIAAAVYIALFSCFMGYKAIQTLLWWAMLNESVKNGYKHRFKEIVGPILWAVAVSAFLISLLYLMM